MSKAEEKRNKQLRATLTHKMSFKLKGFKNLYLGDYAEFEKMQIERSLKRSQFLIDNPLKLLKLNDERRKNSRDPRYYSPLTVFELDGRVKNYEAKLKNDNSNLLEWLNEANDNYSRKFEKLIDKLVFHGISSLRLKIERIVSNGSVFEFEITDDKITIHARVIYACGEVNAPHYRFIVTKRGK